MTYDRFDLTNSVLAMQRRMLAFDPAEMYRNVLGPTSTASAVSKILTDYQNSMLVVAGLNQSALDLFASNWAVADSIIDSGAYKTLELGFGSQAAIDSVLSSLYQPKFEPFRDTVLADFAYGSSALKTLSDISAGLGPGSMLALQGQMLTDTYASFVEGLGAKALTAAIGAAGLSAATANLERSIASLALLGELEGISDSLPYEPLVPNWFDVFSGEIDDIDLEADTIDIERAEQFIATTETVRLADLARAIVEIRHEINAASETVSGEPIFKPTSKGELISGLLSLVVAQSREDFDLLSERLYFYFYESSGEWKRVLVYDPNFPEVALRIKHFRTYAAHDTQHGSASEIRNKAMRVGDHFNALIGQRSPANPGGWFSAQLALFQEILDYLRHLHALVVGRSPSA